MVWVNLSFLTSEINSYHEQYLGRQINHFPIEVGAQYFANANYCSARNNFFRGTAAQTNTKNLQIMGSSSSRCSAYKYEKIVITHSSIFWLHVINHMETHDGLSQDVN